MRLVSIELHNIRSYTDETVEFPEGSVLLSGDIGSGKSSILLALEFALFGVRKPAITGASLLRKGKNEGSVKLRMNVDSKEIIIKRTLKKSNHDIKQDKGYIIVEGKKTDATPVELKARIISLLGYPKDLLTKHKDIIYRYTVYTPQEEMKAILFEDEDTRLNTLRKVFGIDKYKRIRENGLVYIKTLKDKRRQSLGSIYDLSEKQELLRNKKAELSETREKIKALKPQLDNVKSLVKEAKAKLVSMEQDIILLKNSRKEIEVMDARLNSMLKQRKSYAEELIELEKKISMLKAEIPQEAQSADDVKKEILSLEKEISENEKLSKNVNFKVSEFEIKKKSSIEVIEKISRLDICPMCEQEVTVKHKSEISDREKDKIEVLRAASVDAFRRQDEIIKHMLHQKAMLKALQKKQTECAVAAEKKKSLKEKTAASEKILLRQNEIKKEIGSINQKKMDANKAIFGMAGIEQDYTIISKEHEGLLRDERVLELELAGIQNRAAEMEKTLNMLKNEVDEKNSIKESIKEISALINWLEEYFMNLLSTMEKHVMSQLYREFNDSFVEWFSQLIDDEVIIARLDDEFSPVIEQNGYENELVNLSGGEKTAVALAYRLALNKVINDFISHIKTKDIIILDEPTDGFSDDQLDRVRELLENINISQIIIVSHENKIETFVDSIIRVSKTEHVSRIQKL